MTEHACNFIHPITFETLTGNKCVIDTFDRNFQYNVEHVALAEESRCLYRGACNGQCGCKIGSRSCRRYADYHVSGLQLSKIVAPAMNTAMYENPVTQDNLRRLKQYGVKNRGAGVRSSGLRRYRSGKMLEPEELYRYVEREIARSKDLAGRKVLVTAGATRESRGSGKVYHQSFFGKDGILPGRRMYAPRCGGDACKRVYHG